MSEVAQADRVRVSEKIGYGLGDTASNIVFQMVMMFMPFFYTDIFGISAAAMGTLFLVVRVFDAVTDPLMGALCDRTQTRWGKFRPYLLALAVPYAVLAVLAFTTPDTDAGGKLIWAYVTYSLLMAAYTAINIPYCALGGVISGDTRERVSLNSYRFFLATGAGVLIAATTMTLVAKLGQGNDQKGFQLTMGAFGFLAVIMFFACFFLTKERVVQATDKAGSFWNDIKLLLANDQWVIIAVSCFVVLVPLVIRGGGAIYYLTWYAERTDLVSSFLTAGMVAAMIGASLASTLAKRLPKVKSFMLIHTIIAVASATMFLVGKESIALMFAFYVVVQFFTQMAAPIQWTLMADSDDYGEHKHGRRMTGLIFSGALFALKLGMALGGAVLGWLLAYFGYQGDAATQTPGAITGIVATFTVVPALGHLLVIWVMSRCKLTEERSQAIRQELDARGEAGEA